MQSIKSRSDETQFWFRFFTKLVIFLTLAIVILVLLPTEWKVSDADTAGAFLGTVGIIYAIFAGWAFVRLHNRFNTINRTIYDAMIAFANIRELLLCIRDKAIQKGIMEKLKKFADKIIKIELFEALYKYDRLMKNYKGWGKLISNPVNVITGGFLELKFYNKPEVEEITEEKELLEAVEEICSANRRNSDVVFDNVINRITQIKACRIRLYALRQENLDHILRFILVFMSCVLVFGLILLPNVYFWTHIILVAFLVFALHALHMVISDLDNPFEGHWKIDTNMYETIWNEVVIPEEE